MNLIMPEVDHRLEAQDLLPIVEEIHGIIAGDDHFPREVLENAKHLKIISRYGTGTDNIDMGAAEELNIEVRNVPEAFTDPVADSALGFMLSFARQIPWIDQQVKNGIWKTFPASTLKESVLGVIGVGNIGKAIIRRAIGFGMTVLGNDIKSIPENFVHESHLDVVSKDEIYRRADFISLNCDLNSTSYHMVDDRAFKLMKPTAVLINTARGDIVDEEAMIKALETGKIAGAGLDVFSGEPLGKDNLLLSMDNVLLSPHNGHSSPMAHDYVNRRSLENLFQGLDIEIGRIAYGGTIKS